MSCSATLRCGVALPPLYPIVNLESQTDPLGFVRRLFEAGAAVVQLRAKNSQIATLEPVAAAVIELAAGYRHKPLVIINDSLELAVKLKAAGLHLGQEDLSPRLAREQLGPDAIIGYSTHTLDQVRAAPIEVLDYLGFGPVFATSSKQNPSPTVGLKLLAEAVKIAQIPIVGIGGIDRLNAGMVFAAGAASVAIIRDLEEAASGGRELSEYFQVVTGNKSLPPR